MLSANAEFVSIHAINQQSRQLRHSGVFSSLLAFYNVDRHMLNTQGRYTAVIYSRAKQQKHYDWLQKLSKHATRQESTKNELYAEKLFSRVFSLKFA